MKTDISRVKQLLHIKKVQYEEVGRRCTKAPGARYASNCPGSSAAPVQIDLATEPQRRSEMVASDGVSSLPQLHLNNKYLGDWDTLQELEDFGELNTALQAAQN